MGLLAQIKSEAQRALQAPGEESLPGWGVFPWGIPPRLRGEQYLKAFGQMPWLRATIHRAAMVFARAKWRLMRGDDEVTDHPVWALWKRPNRRWPGLWLRWLTDIYTWLRGEAFWVVERNVAGLPAELLPVPPNWVISAPPLKDQPFKILWYGQTREVPPERVIWFSEPNPADPFGRGLGVVESLADELDADEYAAQWNKVLFFNKGVPEILVSLKGFTRSQLQEFAHEWELKHGTYLQARRPGFVNAEVEVKRLMETMADMDFVNLRKFARDTIISVIGVPPEVAGVLQHSNRATIESAEYFFAKLLEEPRLESFKETVNSQLLPLFPHSEDLRLEYETPVPEDREFELDVADRGVRGRFLTVNEARRRIGERPVPDGDVWLTPANVVPLPAQTTPQRPSESLPRSEGIVISVIEVLDAQRETKSLWRDVEFGYRDLWEGVHQAFSRESLASQEELESERWLFEARERLEGFVRDLFAELERSLSEGVELGEGIASLVDRVARVYAHWKTKKASRFAASEVGELLKRLRVEASGRETQGLERDLRECLVRALQGQQRRLSVKLREKGVGDELCST